MLSLLGLAVNTLGAFLILIPDIPRLYRLAHRIPPLQTIEVGEKQLYFDHELRPEHTGFDRIATAFFIGSPPLSDTPRLDNLDNMPVHAQFGDQDIRIDGSGFTAKRIVRNEGDAISESTYTIELHSQAGQKLQQRFADHPFTPPNPYLSIESAPGAIPDLIEQYKRRLFFRAGAVLLLAGFALQAFGRAGVSL